MQNYEVRLEGVAPLLMNSDDIAWRGQLDKWLRDPENKRTSKPGDDRTPAWKWLGCCYHDGKQVGVPSDNLMTALREGGAKVPTGRKGQTYKRQSQSGLIVDQMLWPIHTTKGAVKWDDIASLRDEPSYEAHEEAVKPLGFWLFAKGAKVGTSKHVRVRPRFDAWSCAGNITVVDETITEDVLRLILEMAGIYCGLGDWRPSSPSKPGPFGRFNATVRRVK